MDPFGMGRLSPVGWSTLEHAVTLGLMVQGAKCEGMWQHWTEGVCDVSLVQAAQIQH